MHTRRVCVFGAMVAGAVLTLGSVAMACVPGMDHDAVGPAEDVQATSYEVGTVTPQPVNSPAANGASTASSNAAAKQAAANQAAAAQLAAAQAAAAQAAATPAPAAATPAAAPSPAPAPAFSPAVPQVQTTPGGGSSFATIGLVVAAIAVVLGTTAAIMGKRRRPQRGPAVRYRY